MNTSNTIFHDLNIHLCSKFYTQVFIYKKFILQDAAEEVSMWCPVCVASTAIKGYVKTLCRLKAISQWSSKFLGTTDGEQILLLHVFYVAPDLNTVETEIERERLFLKKKKKLLTD